MKRSFIVFLVLGLFGLASYFFIPESAFPSGIGAFVTLLCVAITPLLFGLLYKDLPKGLRIAAIIAGLVILLTYVGIPKSEDYWMRICVGMLSIAYSVFGVTGGLYVHLITTNDRSFAEQEFAAANNECPIKDFEYNAERPTYRHK